MEKLQTRLIELTLKGKPENLKKMAMSQFKRMSFQNEDDFLEFLDDLNPSSEGSERKKEFKVEPDNDSIKSMTKDILKW